MNRIRSSSNLANQIQNTIEFNFIKSIQWSSDGLYLLASLNDNSMQLYQTPTSGSTSDEPWDPIQCYKESELIYDVKWNPLMDSFNMDSFFFISSSLDHPVSLWDACSGKRVMLIFILRKAHIFAEILLIHQISKHLIRSGFH